LDDEEFDEWILAQFQNYLDLKLLYGRELSFKNHLPGFKHIPAERQMDYKLKKRLNDTDRHGCLLVNEKIKDGTIKDIVKSSRRRPP